jgi:hypothetical protein
VISPDPSLPALAEVRADTVVEWRSVLSDLAGEVCEDGVKFGRLVERATELLEYAVELGGLRETLLREIDVAEMPWEVELSPDEAELVYVRPPVYGDGGELVWLSRRDGEFVSFAVMDERDRLTVGLLLGLAGRRLAAVVDGEERRDGEEE